MGAHVVDIEWQRGDARFIDHRYSRAHEWRFDGGAVVRASSSPEIVRVPFSDPAGVDPEEGFVAALSSCHMLWFLDLAARAGFVVDHYADRAQGWLTPREGGRTWLSKVRLAPHVRFTGERLPDEAAVARLHHQAHEECFLAAAVKCELTIEPSWTC